MSKREATMGDRWLPLAIILICSGFFFGRAIARDVVDEAAVELDTLNQSETCIDVDINADSILVAAWSTPTVINQKVVFQIGYGFSEDGGSTWTTGILEPVDEDRLNGGDPSCAFDDSVFTYLCSLPSR
jgi:hypothetical protein